METYAAHIMVAMLSIAILVIYAVSQGVDAETVYMAIIAIAGLGGYEMYRAKKAEVGE